MAWCKARQVAADVGVVGDEDDALLPNLVVVVVVVAVFPRLELSLSLLGLLIVIALSVIKREKGIMYSGST